MLIVAETSYDVLKNYKSALNLQRHRTMCKKSYGDRTVPVEIVRQPYGGSTIL